MFAIRLTNFGYMYSDTFKTLEDAVAKAKDIGFECTILELKKKKMVPVKNVKVF